MISLGSHEFEARFLELLDRVARGEENMITRDGTPLAMLVPVRPGRLDVNTAVERLEQFGKRRSLDGLSIRERIDEGRRY
jgi:prevent-host-death family protein